MYSNLGSLLVDYQLWIELTVKFAPYLLIGAVLIYLLWLATGIVRTRVKARNILNFSLSEALGLAAWQIFSVRRIGLLILFFSGLVGYYGYMVRHTGFYILTYHISSDVVDNFSANISTELFGIAITILIVDRIYDIHDRRQLKARLLREMNSNDNSTALLAVEELREHKWHKNGTLRNRNFREANLSNADFADAHLEGANFLGVNLSNADFTNARLSGAHFHKCNLRGASFFHADLTNLNSFDELIKATTGEFLNERENSLIFRTVGKLTGATMPNGEKYDGRYNAPDDIEFVTEWMGVSLDNAEGMASYYGVDVETYKLGQQQQDGERCDIAEEAERINAFKQLRDTEEEIRCVARRPSWAFDRIVIPISIFALASLAVYMILHLKLKREKFI